MSDPIDHLFVYGTLRLGAAHPMARLLAAGAEPVGRARVRGQLFDLGPYPGLVLGGAAGHWVVGELYALAAESLPGLLARLDVYEGCRRPGEGPGLFRRTEVRAERADGWTARSWVYVYARPLPAARPVASGDWLAHRGGA